MTAETHNITIKYCISFDIKYSLSSYAKYIPIANVPTGIMYFINPKRPPSIGLKCSPIYPDSAYIKTASSILITIITTTATSKLLFFCFFLLFFAFANFSPPLIIKSQTHSITNKFFFLQK